MVNVLLIYVVRWALRRQYLKDINFASDPNVVVRGYGCGIDEIGDQVLIMVLIELTVSFVN